MANCRQSKKLLECIEDNFLDLLLTNANELIGDTRIGGCLGCSDHAMVEFTLQRDMRQAKSKIRMLHFRKANLQLFRELVKHPGKPSSWARVQSRAGRFLRRLSSVLKSSPSPGVASNKWKARNWRG